MVVVEQAIAILEVLETHLRQIPLKVMLVVMEHTVVEMELELVVVEQQRLHQMLWLDNLVEWRCRST